ncbi:hypothetical protein [Streptomyces scopuliridis]|uniref:Uncharacterized protein n=1 Tax=Streptomyces scopuliridis TaxID=452529 RepID=A0ACD4ZPG2_9ACTN|nr:hypothetical protein [Streptomyces scopuliridis]WSC00066.1 hypothetical protein OG835_25775 [Streptomyces scopuliridis]
MKPSVGQIVHYVSYGTPGGEYTPQCRAAIVTELPNPSYNDQEALALCVLNPTGMFFNQGIRHDETRKPGGTWHWPETEES